MNQNNRGKLYKLCLNYIKTLTLRQEFLFLDSEIECPNVKSKLEEDLIFYEERMRDILLEE